MKLALVVPGGVDRSGEYRVIPALLAVIGELAAKHEVHVFALLQEQQPAVWSLAGATIHNIGSSLTRWRAVRAICAEHRRSPFSLIQCFWSGASGQVGVIAAGVLGLAVNVHVAGGELVALRDIGYGGRLHWYGRVAEALVLRHADRVTVASQPMITALLAIGIRAVRVPLGIDQRVWPPRAPVRRQPEAPARLIHVASLNRVKDQTTLLRAFAALVAAGVDFRVDMVGEDTLGGAIQALATKLGLVQRIRFHGFLTQRQLRPLFEAADLLVVTSRHEAGPIATIEAAVLGVPTVGTAVGHISEWAPEAAMAVPVGDATALAAAVHTLIDDEDMRLRLARKAYALAIGLDAGRTALSLVPGASKVAPAG